MSRDMTKKEFARQLAKRGWTDRNSWLGYIECAGISICARNAGDRRRDQLAYLIKQRRRMVELGHCDA